MSQFLSKYQFGIHIVLGLAFGFYFTFGLTYFEIYDFAEGNLSKFNAFAIGIHSLWGVFFLEILFGRWKGKLGIVLLIGATLLSFGLVGLLISLLADQLSPEGVLTTQLFGLTFSHMALLSILPLSIILIIQSSSPIHHEPGVEVQKAQNRPTNSPTPVLKLDIGQGGKMFEVSCADLILVEAADNYCKIHYLKSGVREMEMVRIKMKAVEDKLQDEQFFFRCHRSYLVNGNFVQSIIGTSQNQRLELGHGLESVRVSRSFDLAPLQQLLAHK